MFLHRLRLASDEAVVDHRRSIDETRIRREEFAVANDKAVTDGELGEGDMLLRGGGREYWSIGKTDRRRPGLSITPVLHCSMPHPRPRERKERVVVPVEGQPVAGLPLKQFSAQEKEQESRQRIEVTFAAFACNLVKALPNSAMMPATMGTSMGSTRCRSDGSPRFAFTKFVRS